MTKKVKVDRPQWTDDRAEELQVLRKLLCDISGLNNGNRFIEKVQECIQTAERLSTYSLERPSFMSFLHEDCIANREDQFPPIF